MCAAVNGLMLAYHFYAAKGAVQCIGYIRDQKEAEGRPVVPRAEHYYHLPPVTSAAGPAAVVPTGDRFVIYNFFLSHRSSLGHSLVITQSR